MVQASPPSPLREEDYDAIEAAVMETARGRWFLNEYTQRNRSADTNILLDAIQKLDKSMKREHKGPQINRIQLDLADMQDAISRTKQEIAQIKNEADDGDRFTEASNELDAIINQTEGATQNILNTTEKIQELAWTLREQGVDEKVCDSIDEHSTDIYMACSFQDLTGQRTQKVVQVLRYLEARINEMMSIWGVEDVDMEGERDTLNPEDTRPDAHLLNGPQLENKAFDQNDIDALMDFGSSDSGAEAIDIIEHDIDEAPVIDMVADMAADMTADVAEADADGDGEMDVAEAATAEAAETEVTTEAEEMSAEDAAVASDDNDDEAGSFTFVGKSSEACEDQEADVFAAEEAEIEAESAVEPIEADGADVFAGSDSDAAPTDEMAEDAAETEDLGEAEVADADVMAADDVMGEDTADADVMADEADAMDLDAAVADALPQEMAEADADASADETDTDMEAPDGDMSEAVSELKTGDDVDMVIADDIMMVDADMPEEAEASEEVAVEAVAEVAEDKELDEAEADAMFAEMDSDEDEKPAEMQAGDSDPLSSLSSGERLALFS